MGNTNSQPRVTIKAKGRGPIPPALLNLQNPEYLQSGVVTGAPIMSTGYAAPIMPTVPIAAAGIPPPVVATATTTDTVISGPMLPPRLPPVPVIDHPIQPGIYGATAVGPSIAETFLVQHAPFVAGGPAVIDDTTIINASAPIQPGMSPQPSPQASLTQQQLMLQQQQLMQEEAYNLQGRSTPPLPAGYAEQSYQAAAAYPSDNEATDDDTASYSSFEEEVFTAPAPPRNLAARSYTRRSPNNFRARESPPPMFVRESPPPMYVRESPLPLSGRSRSAYTVAETPYEYSRSRAFDRYQMRVNSRMSAYDQTPDQYGFYPNAYRI